MAPQPASALQTPDEWPDFAVARIVQEVEERRAIDPTSWVPRRARPSKSSATSLTRAAAIRSARAALSGEPGLSSSPVRTTVMSALFSVPAARIARSAASMITSPPFMSPTPGPSTTSPVRFQPWNGLSGSNTVSRWPISSRRLPRPSPLWVAIRWPARPVWVMGIQRTSKPRASNSGRNRRPTCSTPLRFMVPEFTRTSCSRNFTLRS